MFARYFIELPFHAEAVEDAITHEPAAWLPGLATDANLHGDRLLAEVGFGEEIRIARRVEIEFSRPVRMATKTVIPLRWWAENARGLFPSLDADLEIAELGHDRTQIAMSARYVPPFGALGRAIDRTVMSRVAEATLKDFLDRVRERMIAEIDRTVVRPIVHPRG
jgi:hypothetical protein